MTDQDQATSPDLTVKEIGDGHEFARVVSRLQPNARLWLRRCRCEEVVGDLGACTCRIMHPGRGDRCVLCRDGDHYPGLAGYLKLIETRKDPRPMHEQWTGVAAEAFDAHDCD